jgi:hypothetical protein
VHVHVIRVQQVLCDLIFSACVFGETKHCVEERQKAGDGRFRREQRERLDGIDACRAFTRDTRRTSHASDSARTYDRGDAPGGPARSSAWARSAEHAHTNTLCTGTPDTAVSREQQMCTAMPAVRREAPSTHAVD